MYLTRHTDFNGNINQNLQKMFFTEEEGIYAPYKTIKDPRLGSLKFHTLVDIFVE